MTDSLNSCLHLSLKQKQILDSCITQKYVLIEQKVGVACNTAITGIVEILKRDYTLQSDTEITIFRILDFFAPSIAQLSSSLIKCKL